MRISNIDLDTVVLRSGAVARTSPEQKAVAAAGSSPAAKPVPAEPVAMDEAIHRINGRLALEQRSVRVVPRADAQGTVIEVIDPETQEVIRQIPPAELLKLAAWFEEKGLLSQQHSPGGLAFDETA